MWGSRALIGAGVFAVLAVGCAAMLPLPLPHPYITSLYTGGGTPVALPDSARVDIFLRENPPQREYEPLGTVEIATDNHWRSTDNMLMYARREARKMGGEAIIDAELGSQPVAEGEGTGQRRTFRGLVVRWKPTQP
jgi:hypothetical protein